MLQKHGVIQDTGGLLELDDTMTKPSYTQGILVNGRDMNNAIRCFILENLLQELSEKIL